MSGRTVVVVGAVNVDLVVAAPRLPGPGETVVGGGVSRHAGGKGANAAVAAARAGADVRLVGAVGADEHGRTSLAELVADGVDPRHVAVLDDVPTGVALIVVDAAGENQIAVGAGANAAVSAAHVRAALDDALPAAGCVLVSTEITPAAVAAAVERAAAAKVPCVLNPAPVIDVVGELLRYGPILTPNASECAHLARLVGARSPAQGPVPAGARALVEHTGAPVIVTLGGDGAVVLGPDGAAEPVPPSPATVRDTTGAGDTFNGVLAARLADGDQMAVAVRLASVAAALSVGRVGARAGMPTAEQIAEAAGG
ncbi:PfkB family carbohydrate kinase [Pseudonocardia sp.]|uniref:PfkB family carbohydrate kinase n=1 Tax=Pseudonocardia sp. TaxID=60912 RepID=UPI003D0E0F74